MPAVSASYKIRQKYFTEHHHSRLIHFPYLRYFTSRPLRDDTYYHFLPGPTEGTRREEADMVRSRRKVEMEFKPRGVDYSHLRVQYSKHIITELGYLLVIRPLPPRH